MPGRRRALRWLGSQLLYRRCQADGPEPMRTSRRNLHHQLLRSRVLIFLNRAMAPFRGGKHDRPPSQSPRLRMSALDHPRLKRAKPHHGACPLRPESGQGGIIMKRPSRRSPYLIVAGALSILLGLTAAWSQTARTVKIVVPYPAGGTADILARILGEQISRTEGVTLLTENRPGASAVIGTEAVSRA